VLIVTVNILNNSKEKEKKDTIPLHHGPESDHWQTKIIHGCALKELNTLKEQDEHYIFCHFLFFFYP
jgi:hypothetical protein